MTQDKILSPTDKQRLKSIAEKDIADLSTNLQTKIEDYRHKAAAERDMIPQLLEDDLETLAETTAVADEVVAKINLFEDHANELEHLQKSPYFLKLDLIWKETGEAETIYIGKFAYTQEKIYSWFSPIATLRYVGTGSGEYQRVNGSVRQTDITQKDDYIIQNAEIVFMTHESTDAPRQVIFQKHIAQHREFMLPEIVAELDKLQDQIIRTSPQGPFLISGPAGSGKTTLALHRVAYLVLTPEFKDYFEPERIMVFVADDGAVKYFSNLLPELGIHGVKITTFNDWSTMIVNSRWRQSKRFRFLDQSIAIEQIEAHNPFPDLHPMLTWEEFKKYKQEMIQKIIIKEGAVTQIYPALFELYETAMHGRDDAVVAAFQSYLKFQKTNRYLDEIDLIILLNSTTKPIEPFVHILVDEVQNWLPSQLKFIYTILSKKYSAVTYIGDIRQKTKPFTVASWQEIEPQFENETDRKVELLKVYRNTKPILQHLQEKGYDVHVPDNARSGPGVTAHTVTSTELESLGSKLIAEHKQAYPDTQIGFLAKFPEDLADIAHLANIDENIHALTIQEAQGLEFHTVVLLNPSSLHTTADNYSEQVGHVSASEYTEQDQHLYYVAATRAREKLVLCHVLID